MSLSRMTYFCLAGIVCCALVGFAPSSQAALEDGLLAHWNFNDGGFTATNGDTAFDGQPVNGAYVDTEAGFDGALRLDYSQYVAIGVPVVQVGQPHTYSVWYKSQYSGYALDDTFSVLESTTADSLGVGPISYQLRGDVSGDIGLVRCQTALHDTLHSDVTKGGGIGWHNIIVTYDAGAPGAEHTVYLDGELVTNMASSNALLAATGLNIGGSCWGDTDTWVGWIDDVQIWDRVLAPAEITEIQGDLARDLYLSLGLDEAWYQSGSVEFASGAEDSRYYSRLASEFDMVNDKIMLSTGIGLDAGLGDSDLADDGLPDVCTFQFTFRVPNDKNAIHFTTQLSSAEMDQSRSADNYKITVKETYGFEWVTQSSTNLPNQDFVDETQPPLSFIIELNENNPPDSRMLTLTFEVQDSVDGILDSGLGVSWLQLTEDGYFGDIWFSEPFRFRSAPPGDSRLAAGSYTFAQDIVSVPSPMPIRFSVVYNSQSSRYGALGKKWVHSYDIALHKSKGDAIILHGNGAASYFEQVSPGVYEPKYPGIKGSLTDAGGGYFTYVSDDRMTFHFRPGLYDDDVCFVEDIVDRYGNTTYFHYAYNSLARYEEQLEEVTTGNHSLSLAYWTRFGRSMLSYVSVNGVGIVDFGYEEVFLPTYSLLNLESINYSIYDWSTEEQERYFFSYNTDFPEDSLVETVTNGLGEVEVTNEYGHKQYLTVQTDAAGNRTTNTYLGTQIQNTDKMNQVTVRHYNADLKLSTLDKQGIGTATFEYNEDGRTTKVTDALGNETVMDYDDEGNLTYLRDYEGHVITMEYEGGNLLRRTDQAGKDWTFTYDENDNVLSESDPLGHTTSYTYGGNGLRSSKTDPNGNTTYYEHDAYGFGARVVDPMGGVTSVVSDKLGYPTSVTDANGYTTFMQSDIRGRQLNLVNPVGGETTTTYNLAGRKVRQEVTNYPAPSQITNYEYNVMGQMVSVSSGDDPPFGIDYNADGTRWRFTDPLGRQTIFGYDAQGRLDSVNAPEGTSSSKSYNECTSVSFTTPNGETHSRSSDNLGRTTSETDPRGNTTSFTYDPRGLLSHMVNGRGQTISFEHDDAGRSTGMSFPGGAIEHTLDPVGNRTSSTSSSYSSVSRSFDGANRLVSRTDDHGRTVGYRYDAAGNIIEIIYPDLASVQYTYDAAGRMTSVTDWDGRVTSYEYTLDGYPTRSFLPDSSAVTFEYDSSGRMVSKVDWLPGTGEIFRTDYAFDSASRITSANRTLPLEPVFSEIGDQFSYLADMIEDMNGQGMAYDGDGNMTSGLISGAPMSFEYDPLNRLTRAGADEYGYDTDGLRVHSVINGQTRQYVHDAIAGTARVLVEYDQMGNIVARYVYGRGLISRQEAGGDVAVYHFDTLGSTVALVSEAGDITDTYAYGPFGKVLNRTGVTENPFLYCGQYAVMDDGNGLNLMRLRYYAPELMRFIQKDQIEAGDAAQPQTLNRHAYVMGNPVTNIDPNGDWKMNPLDWVSAAVTVADIATDLWHGDDVDWGDAFESLGFLVGGIVVGAIIGAGVVAIGGTAVVGMVAGFVAVELIILMIDLVRGDVWSLQDGHTTTGGLIDSIRDLVTPRLTPKDKDEDGNDTGDDFNDFWPDRENFDGGMSLARQASLMNGAMAESVCPLR